MEALTSEKTVLTAALTAAQLQLKEATPAGFAAEAAELRRQAEAARQEAAAARAEAAVAAAAAGEAQRREAEVRVRTLYGVSGVCNAGSTCAYLQFALPQGLQILEGLQILPLTAPPQAAGHMREAARCMEAAQEARAAGLAREQQLAGEVRSLRQQLAGRLPEGDPARALQVRQAAAAARRQVSAGRQVWCTPLCCIQL